MSVLLRERLRPDDVPAERLTSCLGLLSDTHVHRPADFPSGVVRTAFEGVDLICHAGDVGDLAVLDWLSVVAPVVAVRGNDESAAGREVLPLMQPFAAGALRLLLMHSNHPDLERELALRGNDDWEARLVWIGQQAELADAQVLIYGHTHVPMVLERDGVVIVNPGAVTRGNGRARQIHRTIAFLYIRDDGKPFVVHLDLNHPERPFDPVVDLGAGFHAARVNVTDSILSPELDELYLAILSWVATLSPEQGAAIRILWDRLAEPCWDGSHVITPQSLLNEAFTDPALTASTRDELAKVLDE